MQRRALRALLLLVSTVALLLLLVQAVRTFRYRSRLALESDHTQLLLPVQRAAAANTSERAEVPRVVHQTYFSKARVPSKVARNFAAFAADYERRLYDDADVEAFLSKHFVPGVLAAFRNLKYGAHKADLFRYAVLYVHGGVYLDIKTELVRPLANLFPPLRVSTVISRTGDIYQGVIAAPPRRPIFLALIAAIMQSGRAPPYHLFTQEFMRFIRADAGRAREGELAGTREAYFLFTEKCSRSTEGCEDGLDRYGVCCGVHAKQERVIKTRYADFPW